MSKYKEILAIISELHKDDQALPTGDEGRYI
jgi:hypothetical protein